MKSLGDVVLRLNGKGSACRLHAWQTDEDQSQRNSQRRILHAHQTCSTQLDFRMIANTLIHFINLNCILCSITKISLIIQYIYVSTVT